MITTETGTGITGYSTDVACVMYDLSRRSWRGLLIALHGDHQSAIDWGPKAGALNEFNHVRALVQAGYVVISIDAAGPSNWGGSAAQTAIGNAVTYGKARFGLTKHAVLGYSMGGDDALNHIKRDTDCLGGWLISPVTDAKWCYGATGAASYTPGTVAPSGLFKTELDAVFGSTDSASFLAAAAGYLIVDEPASFRGVPLMVLHAVDDPILPVGMSRAFNSAVGGNVTYIELSTGGHFAFSQVNPAITVGFFDSLNLF